MLSAARRAAERSLAPFRPDVDGPWDARAAGHLLRRAAWGGPLAARTAVLAAGPARAVEELTADAPPAGEFRAVLDALAPLRDLADPDLARATWLLRMLRDPAPFGERLTLFWHGHFATSVEKVGSAALMVAQVETLRRLGPGDFGSLVRAVCRDPAMIVWLDGNANRRYHPNENFARELMELFTLGIDHYAEADVLEAARAFSGWHEKDGRFAFRAHEHDDGDKSVLDRHGKLDGEDVIAAILEQPACATHVAGRLWRHFVEPRPDAARLEAVAGAWRSLGGDTLAFLRLALGSRAAFEPAARRALVASPVDYAVGCARRLGLQPDAGALAATLADLGQSLYAPPSVKGWDGGRNWLNAATLMGRIRLAGVLASAAAARPEALAAAVGGPPTDDALVDLLFEGDWPPGAREALADAGDDLAARLQLLLSVPEAQLA